MTLKEPQQAQPSPKESPKLHQQIVPGGHGYAFSISKGNKFRIIDLHGRQIVDLMAWVLPTSPLSPPQIPSQFPRYDSTNEHLSMSYTRYTLNGTAPPAIGDYLVTNKQEPCFRITADTCHTHDMTFMACNPAFYADKGYPGHRNCAENIAEAMRPWDMRSYLEAAKVDPFNVFQNTPDMTLKDLGCSRAGDYVELEVLKHVVIAVSSCPYDVVSVEFCNVRLVALLGLVLGNADWNT